MQCSPSGSGARHIAHVQRGFKNAIALRRHRSLLAEYLTVSDFGARCPSHASTTVESHRRARATRRTVVGLVGARGGGEPTKSFAGVPPRTYSYYGYYKRRRHLLNESSEIVPTHMNDYGTSRK